MDILLASSNMHKCKELESLLQGQRLHLPSEFGISFSCDETGITFAENARQKAQALFDVSASTGMAVMADDSGLLVDALPKELGVRTARFGSADGQPSLPSDVKNALLLERMKGLSEDKRGARFVCSLVLMTRDGDVIEAEGVTEGRILEHPVGDGGFGYDPVFFCNDAKSPMALLSEQEKNIFSHRGRASRALLAKITKKEKNTMAKDIPARSEIREEDKWDLLSLYATDKDWESDMETLKGLIKDADALKGRLGDSKESLRKGLDWMFNAFMLAERLGNYAHLNQSAEAQNADNQRRMGIYMQVGTQLDAAASFIDPEILEIKEIDSWIDDPLFDDCRIYLKKLLRQRQHTLSQKEEALLAKQSELLGTASDAFSMLTNVDMDFGKVNGKPLSQSTWSSFMISQDREERKEAYGQFYETYRKHEQTIATLYAGSVKQDIFKARVRGFDTALDAALFRDDVPKSVYLGLIEAVHNAFPTLHRYYALRKKLMGLDHLKHYDVYVPLVKSVKTVTPYEDAVKAIRTALAPLGKEYVDTITAGLTTERWVDRYENKGKRSGAFSSGGFIGKPYILINYKEDVLGDVFTLAHEGGHSMHSWYSKHNNPFPYYDYTIFEAEVASTFNEQLMAKYYMDNAKDPEMKAYIICRQLDDIVATLFRQTMFAEFEYLTHTQVENGEPLTVESLRKTYRSLLEAYFGPDMEFEDTSDLEGLRIPHFYRAYYVYKYATGISAAIALSTRVLNGGKAELDDYLGFLKSGGSKFPIESLKKAGVDMSTQAPVEAAVAKFASLLDEMEKLLVK